MRMDKTVINNKLNRHLLRRIALAIFCLFIGISVIYVMFGVYEPSINSIAALSSVCMDIICIIILFVLILSIIFGHYGSKRTTRVFAVLIVATIWAIFLDFLNWAFDGSLEFGEYTFWFTLGSLCMGSILAAIFSIYLYSYMDETHHISMMRPRALVCAIMNVVSFFVTFLLAITGTAFSFVDGHYQTGVLYDIVTTVPVLSLLYLTGVVIRNVKTIGTHDVVAVAGYIFFMIAGALIEGEYVIGTTYVAVAIADIFIFAMLQNEIIALEKQNVRKWKEKSYTDELTGLYNRYAYEADIKSLESDILGDNFVYFSVDVNSLKMVNDSLGHSAGDEMLIGVAQCLKTCLSPYGKVYRTGGDEFVALIFADKDQINRIKQDVEESTAAWTGEQIESFTLSYGLVTKAETPEMTIREMGVVADKRMYEAKNEYYRRTGIERRKI